MKHLFCLLFTLTILNFSLSQELEIVHYIEQKELKESIQLNDLLLSKYQEKAYFLALINDSILSETKTIKHFYEFYKSNEVFSFDSIHAKVKIKEIKILIDKTIEKELNREKKDYYCHDDQTHRILKEARKAKEKGETEKSMEYYKRYLMIRPSDLEVKKEFEDYKQKVQGSQK